MYFSIAYSLYVFRYFSLSSLLPYLKYFFLYLNIMQRPVEDKITLLYFNGDKELDMIIIKHHGITEPWFLVGMDQKVAS